MTLNQKDLKKIAKAVEITSRIKELELQSPYLPSVVVLKRKAALKKQLRELINGKEEVEEQKINIKIELPETEKKEKSFSINLGNLFSGKVKETEDDEPIVRVVRGLFPEEELTSLGKFVQEL